MKTGDIIHKEKDFTIKYMGTTPVPAYVIVNGKQVPTGGLRGHVFNLYKNDIFLKTHSIAERLSKPSTEEKQTVIKIFKKYMV